MSYSVRRPDRVVSLVPSLTETVFVLGAGGRLVGRTRWCIEPREAAAIALAGGTKDPDLARIRALAPDLVLANREENRREDVEALQRFTRVLVTYPRSPLEAAAMVDEIGVELGTELAAAALSQEIRAARERSAAGTSRRPRVAYLIWREPWMSVTSDTYIGALLSDAGFDNVFAETPGRYPPIELPALTRAQPDLVLLPDEPFCFGERHREELLAAGVAPRVQRVSGAPFSWFGAQTAAGLDLASGERRRLERKA